MRIYTNSEVTTIINECVHSERDRKILLRKYVDGITHEKIAEEFDLCPKQISNIIYKYDKIIFKSS